MDVWLLSSAPGRLRIDLARARRQLARRLRAAPRPGAAPPSSRPTLTGPASPKPRRRCGPRARASSSSPISTRGSRRGGRCRRRRAIYVLNGLESGAEPADYVEHRLAPVIGGEEELERWSAFAARRNWTSPCAIHLDTGMNRLGFESLARLQSAMETHGATSGADLLMSHFVSSEIPGDPLNQAQIERFEAARAAFPGLAASLANSSGMFLDPSPIYDLAPSGLRALRRQSDAGPPEPDAARRDPDRGDPADTLNRSGHELRLQRPMDRQAPDPARDPADRLCRRPAARGRRNRCEAGRRSRGRRAQGAAGRARVDGPRPSSTSPTCPRTAFAWAIRSSSSADDRPRRLRVPQRHDRLSPFDQPRPPLSAGVRPLDLPSSGRAEQPAYFAGAAGAGAARPGAGAAGAAAAPLCCCSSALRCSSAFFCSCCCNAWRCCSRTLGSVGLPSNAEPRSFRGMLNVSSRPESRRQGRA